MGQIRSTLLVSPALVLSLSKGPVGGVSSIPHTCRAGHSNRWHNGIVPEHSPPPVTPSEAQRSRGVYSNNPLRPISPTCPTGPTCPICPTLFYITLNSPLTPLIGPQLYAAGFLFHRSPAGNRSPAFTQS